MAQPFKRSLFNEEELAWLREARLNLKKAIQSATLRGMAAHRGIFSLQWGAVVTAKESLDYLCRKDEPHAEEEPAAASS